MGFKVEETEDDKKLGYKTFIPEPVDPQTPWHSSHPWLDKVWVGSPSSDRKIEVALMIHVPAHAGDDDEGGKAQFRNVKSNELNLIKKLFEPGAKRWDKDAEEDFVYHDGIFTFDAGPKSKIRSVLIQADIPDDINKAVIEHLQREWAKSL